jgi:hypothetical protein
VRPSEGVAGDCTVVGCGTLSLGGNEKDKQCLPE